MFTVDNVGSINAIFYAPMHAYQMYENTELRLWLNFIELNQVLTMLTDDMMHPSAQADRISASASYYRLKA